MGGTHKEKQNTQTVLLLDVLAAWEAIEDDHGVELVLTCCRVKNGSPGQLQASVRVAYGPEITEAEQDIKATWSWPTTHHKTFLGMLLWLLHQVDSEVTAQRALAGIPQFPPSSP